MVLYEDMCVGCPPEIGCLGSTCPYKKVEIRYCDKCNSLADYIFEEADYCEECLREVLRRDFASLCTTDMLEVFGYPYDKL